MTTISLDVEAFQERLREFIASESYDDYYGRALGVGNTQDEQDAFIEDLTNLIVPTYEYNTARWNERDQEAWDIPDQWYETALQAADDIELFYTTETDEEWEDHLVVVRRIKSLPSGKVERYNPRG